MATDKSVLNRLDNLEQMVLGLATRINKIADSANGVVKASEIAKEWRKKSNELNNPEQNLKHYDENYMPRLDKYLAYLEIESNQFPDKKAVYLITNHCSFEFTSIEDSHECSSCTRVNFRELIDIETFKKRTVQFRFDGKKASFENLYSAQQAFKRCIDRLINGKKLTVESIYGNVENEFRTIKIKDYDVTSISIYNTIYSLYGYMEENEPLYKETIYTQPIIHEYK